MSIADVLMTSKKRRDILISLRDGARTNKEIKASLNIDQVLLKHPIRELKEEEFIVQDDNSYQLSNIGKIMVEATLPLLNTLTVFEKDILYWRSRNLDIVPEELTEKIGELSDCNVVKLNVNEMFEPLKNYLNNCQNLKSLEILLTIVEPTAPKLLLLFAEMGSKISLLVTKEYLEKIKQIAYEELSILLELENVSIQVFEKDLKPPQIMLSDTTMATIFFNETDKYDYMEIVSYNENALNWGKELFLHYKNISHPLTEI
ncbi:helix-turn-helix transcriptional regulator [Methanococcoides sp. FTZ1]|uniref:helix-turn-helix transcriptional regulator n=1 Tax=Methanococcoides sp. FTZ1 TaxID=3439061 RepID=UPI003F859BD0